MSAFTTAQPENSFLHVQLSDRTHSSSKRVASEGLSDIMNFAYVKENEIKMTLENVRQGIHSIQGIPVIPERTNSRGTIIQAAVPAVHSI